MARHSEVQCKIIQSLLCLCWCRWSCRGLDSCHLIKVGFAYSLATLPSPLLSSPLLSSPLPQRLSRVFPCRAMLCNPSTSPLLPSTSHHRSAPHLTSGIPSSALFRVLRPVQPPPATQPWMLPPSPPTDPFNAAMSGSGNGGVGAAGDDGEPASSAGAPSMNNSQGAVGWWFARRDCLFLLHPVVFVCWGSKIHTVVDTASSAISSSPMFDDGLRCCYTYSSCLSPRYIPHPRTDFQSSSTPLQLGHLSCQS